MERIRHSDIESNWSRWTNHNFILSINFVSSTTISVIKSTTSTSLWLISCRDIMLGSHKIPALNIHALGSHPVWLYPMPRRKIGVVVRDRYGTTESVSRQHFHRNQAENGSNIPGLGYCLVKANGLPFASSYLQLPKNFSLNQFITIGGYCFVIRAILKKKQNQKQQVNECTYKCTNKLNITVTTVALGCSGLLTFSPAILAGIARGTADGLVQCS